MPIFFGPSTRKKLAALTSDLASLAFSYPEVGATRGEFPTGYTHDRYEAELGEGDERFERAKLGLQQWIPQQTASIGVLPADAVVKPEESFLLTILENSIFAVAAPSRIVYVVDEPNEYGFAYGTLQGHPEMGEVSFVLQKSENSVTFEIASFSKRANVLARLAQPLSRYLQIRATKAYVAGLKSFANEITSG